MDEKDTKKSMSTGMVIGIAVIIAIVLGGGLGFYIYKNNTASKNEQTTPAAEQSINYSVVVKENPTDTTKTDVYLKDPKTAQETFYITLLDINRSHYHNAEYHNGNLYIISRTGYSGYETSPNWIDELWRYNQQKQGQKLYSVRGLDFRVTDDEKMIAIVTNDEFNLLHNNGDKIKTFRSSEVIANSQYSPAFGFSAWGSNSVWLENNIGPNLVGMAKIDTQTYSVTKYDLSELSAGSEYDFNTQKEKVVFSDYPAMMDGDSAKEYQQSGDKVNLVVYDLKTKAELQIATSITKKFEPKWIDENTLEYNNPDGAGRITKLIP